MRGFACRHPEQPPLRARGRSSGFCDDEAVLLICPTCQVSAQSVGSGGRLLLCMGLFSIFLAGAAATRRDSETPCPKGHMLAWPLLPTKMARPTRFERVSFAFVAQCSFRLSSESRNLISPCPPRTLGMFCTWARGAPAQLSCGYLGARQSRSPTHHVVVTCKITKFAPRDPRRWRDEK